MTKPVLRFPEFNDDWEEVMFGDLVTVHNENTSDKKNYPLYSLTIEDGVTPKTERYEREFLIRKEGDVYKIVPPNAFVYNPMNLRFGALKMNHESFAVSVSGYYDVFSIGDENTYKFWEYYLTTPKMLHYYFSIANGSLIEKLRVHFSQFVKIVKPIPIPKEQEKIATLFSSVDEVISAIESEVALWEEKKKGVMQKIFSQEVRFKKEDDLHFPEWRNYQFSEIAELSKEKYNPKSGDIYKCIELDNIEQGTGVINGCVDSSIQNSIKNVFHVGDVLFGKLRPYLKKYARPNFAGVCSSEIWVLRPKKEMVSTDYLYCLIASDAFIAVSNVSSGTKMPRADWKLVACSTFDIPSLNEQQKIANCIVSIEKVIGIKKKKLEIWKTIKKGLVQQMFV